MRQIALLSNARRVALCTKCPLMAASTTMKYANTLLNASHTSTEAVPLNVYTLQDMCI